MDRTHRKKRSNKLLGGSAALVLATGGLMAATTLGSSAGAAESEQARAAVPAHAVTGYWQNFDNGATVQKLGDVQDGYDIIAVAFADATGTDGQIEFNLDPAVGYASEDDFKADIAAKQEAGKSVVISVGGELGNVTVDDAESAQQFADSTYALMEEYGFDGVDI
ncbi:chitinase, partial [Streptomyces sp. SID7982]|nr:chitinase [Streptomyces sp. SID7982]